MADRPLTILFMPESAYGPTNNCVGIGAILRDRGLRVAFAAEASWKGKLEPLGFIEDLVDLAPPPEDGATQDAGQFWKDFIRDTAPEFRKSTLDQLETFMAPTWQALIDGARYCEPQLRDILARQTPDVIVEDNVVAFPALVTHGAPFVRIVSCNPLEVKGPRIPPAYSGLPADDDSAWLDFRVEYDRTHRPMWTDFDVWVQSQGAEPLPPLEFIHASRELNLYVYPEELDYVEQRPLDTTWHRLDSSVRETDPDAGLPADLAGRPPAGGLIYLSLGSLGSADVDLMRRLVEVLGQTRHRFVVSKGPQHAEFELAPNMWGAEFLPQTRIIPMVDAVITHGGNNTMTEALHFGKPLIALPLFWDQYDNAQRVDEMGYGVRLDTYRFDEGDMSAALDRILGDEALRARVAAAGERIRSADGVRRAADLIEGLGLSRRS
ncbi:glycosyltransferase [soil metagenome]